MVGFRTPERFRVEKGLGLTEESEEGNTEGKEYTLGRVYGRSVEKERVGVGTGLHWGGEGVRVKGG